MIRLDGACLRPSTNEVSPPYCLQPFTGGWLTHPTIPIQSADRMFHPLYKEVELEFIRISGAYQYVSTDIEGPKAGQTDFLRARV